MRKILPVLALFVTLGFSSCATMFSGTKDSVVIVSTPSDAVVEINGMVYGRTPLTLPMKKSFYPAMVVIKKEGYEQKIIQPQNTFNATSILNIFVPVGFIIDAATGAMMSYDPKYYEVKLDPEK